MTAIPTPDQIEAARTPGGGWTQEALASWGIPWPPPKGWRRALERQDGISKSSTHPLERTCPTCGALQGEPCEGKRGHRKAFHRARGGVRRSHPMAPVYDLKTESPIEIKMASSIRGWIEHHDAAASISTQVQIGRYRADILIEAAGRRLVVECDGAAFHGSPEAVERDRRRDRYCAAQGIAVMRFSGSEISRDPRGCAAQVGMWITRR